MPLSNKPSSSNSEQIKKPIFEKPKFDEKERAKRLNETKEHTEDNTKALQNLENQFADSGNEKFKDYGNDVAAFEADLEARKNAGEEIRGLAETPTEIKDMKEDDDLNINTKSKGGANFNF